METITTNISGKVRIEHLDGRKYLVVPITLIVPGVLNGSKGPLYYPREEIGKNFEAWNGIPIVLNHPKENGRQVSARNPKILSKQGIGTVFKTSSNGKLTAEGWFDVEKTRKIDNRILERLEDGISIESSTGLGVTNKPAEPNASFNGVEYGSIATDYKPDHLAILPDDVGACSIDDGCGVLVNDKSSTKEGRNMAKLTAKKRTKLIDDIIENCECPDDDREVFENLSDVALVTMQKSYQESTELIANSKTLKAVADAARKGFEDPGGNTHVYNEETKEWETTLKEKELEKEEKEVENKEEKEPQTFDEWMEAAPEEVRSAVANSRKIEEGEKRRLVDRIIFSLDEGDSRTKLSKRLMGKSLTELEEFSVLAPKQDEASPIANYAGAAVPAHNNKSTEFDKTDVLGLPTMEFSEAK